MCGVVGTWRHDGGPADEAEIARMLETLLHRGPDDGGTWAKGHVALGHRRLSIIDLSAAGHQPMLTPDGAGVLSYNGEIYNYRGLRQDLERDGATFRSHTDSEVLLLALHLWGPERTIPLLDGMFAFAYLDRRSNALWLARDRLGIKQLYTTQTGRELHFASEIKALIANRRLDIRVDEDAVQRRFLGAPSPQLTLYRNVIGLEAGSWWKVTPGAIDKHRYFTIEDALDIDRLAAASRDRDAPSFIADIRSTLTRSVEMHMVSDAPVAAMCSGGVDSSLVAALAHDRLPNLVGYVADVPPRSGEGDQAERAGSHIGIPIRRIPIDRKEYLRLWPLAVRQFDGPLYHASEPAMLAVAEACRRDGIKVVLCGEGADELFGGYPQHASAALRWSFRDLRTRLGLSRAGRTGLWDLLPVFSQQKGGGFDAGVRHAMARDANQGYEAGRFFEKLAPLGDHAARGFLTQGLTDLNHHLGWLLNRHDHMGMAASIELRVPFIENAMIDLGLHMPYGAKYRRGHGKWAEKMVALERLPRRVVLAKKKGFPMPGRYTRGTERLLADGQLPQLMGWSRPTTASIIRSLAHTTELRLTAVSMEIWLRQLLAGNSAGEVTEHLMALAA